MTSIAIMQPYLFPYLGYYQLVNHVDKFVFLDDVNYITGGWINRNKIRMGKSESLFTAPLKKSSQNVYIQDQYLSPEYSRWQTKFLKTLRHAYGKSPNYEKATKEVEKILSADPPSTTIATLASRSVVELSRYMGMTTEFLYSSLLNCPGKGEEKIINICNELGATTYTNAIGGMSLYSEENFNKYDISLGFLQCSKPNQYLSIIDLLMHLPAEELLKHLSLYDILFHNDTDEGT